MTCVRFISRNHSQEKFNLKKMKKKERKDWFINLNGK